ncbi:hypothetical protein DSL92_04605 [Billgrantia gudaonensis]|uniref:Serine aminopeptidase S33 domain-containing protein n=1 Tax=Billgrantia gudaonensis TaxID=376427 RepID=A0A432JKC8_9GAMM|nr:hypothetical protein DSL92_04605 [Halomonas gudaonensis]
MWPGHARLAQDVTTLLARLLHERHPDTPLYLVGKSMGAAVVILSSPTTPHPRWPWQRADLPAVWGFDTMPWYQRLGLYGCGFFPA